MVLYFASRVSWLLV